jgi:hypothetical protein
MNAARGGPPPSRSWGAPPSGVPAEPSWEPAPAVAGVSPEPQGLRGSVLRGRRSEPGKGPPPPAPRLDLPKPLPQAAPHMAGVYRETQAAFANHAIVTSAARSAGSGVASSIAAAMVASQLQSPWAFLVVGLALWAAIVYLWWPAGKVSPTPPVTPKVHSK